MVIFQSLAKIPIAYTNPSSSLFPSHPTAEYGHVWLWIPESVGSELVYNVTTLRQRREYVSLCETSAFIQWNKTIESAVALQEFWICLPNITIALFPRLVKIWHMSFTAWSQLPACLVFTTFLVYILPCFHTIIDLLNLLWQTQRISIITWCLCLCSTNKIGQKLWWFIINNF